MPTRTHIKDKELETKNIKKQIFILRVIEVILIVLLVLGFSAVCFSQAKNLNLMKTITRDLPASRTDQAKYLFEIQQLFDTSVISIQHLDTLNQRDYNTSNIKHTTYNTKIQIN